MKPYSELFGWEFQAPDDLGALGTFHPLTWKAGGPSVGVMADVQGRAGVHPHWLFYWGVPSLETAVGALRSNGGTASVLTLPTGEKLAVRDDPQGAAFGLREIGVRSESKTN